MCTMSLRRSNKFAEHLQSLVLARGRHKCSLLRDPIQVDVTETRSRHAGFLILHDFDSVYDSGTAKC